MKVFIVCLTRIVHLIFTDALVPLSHWKWIRFGIFGMNFVLSILQRWLKNLWARFLLWHFLQACPNGSFLKFSHFCKTQHLQPTITKPLGFLHNFLKWILVTAKILASISQPLHLKKSLSYKRKFFYFNSNWMINWLSVNNAKRLTIIRVGFSGG